MLLRVLVLLFLGATSARAQIAAALGKRLPSPDLAAGTVSVRVVDGSAVTPDVDLEVTLVVDGVAHTAKTDEAGRARFEHLKVGAKVRARVASSNAPTASSDTFLVPADGGIRIMLSTKPWSATGRAGAKPSARSESGEVREDEHTPAGTIAVILTYDDLNDAKRPAAVPVALIGYASDGRVTVAVEKSDAMGIAQFRGVDQSGATAYFALAQLPRKPGIDRLISRPILPDRQGVRVILSAEARTSANPPVDDLAKLDHVSATAKGKLHVGLEGALAATTPIAIIDAATGKPVATATVTGKELVTAISTKPDQVLYVEATAHGERFRSLPFQPVADRGASVTIYALPRLLPTYKMLVDPFDDLVHVTAQIEVKNNAWMPYPAGLAIPLPHGARKLDVSDEVKATGSSIVVTRPVALGGIVVGVSFELPVARGAVDWTLDVPYGAYESFVLVRHEPGVSLAGPLSTSIETKQIQNIEYIGFPSLTLVPKQTLALTIHVPKPGKDAAVIHACRALAPDMQNHLVGKPIDFELAQLDGKKLKLSSLRGKTVLVNMTASWTSPSDAELPRLAGLRGTGVEVVLVASDHTAKEIADKVGPKPPYRVLLDPPPNATENIGALTSSWGVVALPESFVVDRQGVVRFYFVNTREWGGADARACLKAVAASP